MPIARSVYPPPTNEMALMTSHGIAVACHDKPMSGHAPAHAQPTFPLQHERLFADATGSPQTQCSGATRRAAFKRQTAEVLCSTSGSDIHASSSIAWDQTRRPVPAPCRRLFLRPHWFESSRPDRDRTDHTGVCPSSRSRGVSRPRVRLFRSADHVRLGPLTALTVRRAVGCALRRMSEIAHE